MSVKARAGIAGPSGDKMATTHPCIAECAMPRVKRRTERKFCHGLHCPEHLLDAIAGRYRARGTGNYAQQDLADGCVQARDDRRQPRRGRARVSQNNAKDRRRRSMVGTRNDRQSRDPGRDRRALKNRGIRGRASVRPDAAPCFTRFRPEKSDTDHFGAARCPHCGGPRISACRSKRNAGLIGKPQSAA